MSESIRAFTPVGAKAFANLMARDKRPTTFKNATSWLKEIRDLVTGDMATDTEASMTFVAHPRRREIGQDLWGVFGNGGQLWTRRDESAIWSWIGARYLGEYIRDEVSFSRIEGAVRWIPELVSTRNHRHLFQGPQLVFEANWPNIDAAMAALATPVLAPGEVAERVTGKLALSHGSAIAVATRLYYDESAGSLKVGASSKGPGMAQRLSVFLSQLDLTTDYRRMSADDIFDLLPSEFDRWK